MVHYPVKYRKQFPLEEPEQIMLDLMEAYNDVMRYVFMGRLLGFAVQDDPEKGVYYDAAEDEIFRYLLDKLQKCFLIEIRDGKIYTTDFGKTARKEGVKYKFYEGTIGLPEWQQLYCTDKQRIRFHFDKLGIIPEIKGEKTIEAFDYSAAQQENKLLLQARNCAPECGPLQWIEDTPIQYTSEEVVVKLLLSSANHQWEVKTEIAGQACPELDEIIRLKENAGILQDWQSRLLYALFLERSRYIIAEKLVPYLPFIQWPEILRDPRLIYDEELFRLLADKKVGNIEIWKELVACCPKQILMNYLEEYASWFDWRKLTMKFGKEYVLQTLDRFPWRLELLIDSFSPEEKIELIKKGLLDNVLHCIVQAGETEAGATVIALHELRWDWDYIAANYSLSFLLDNIRLFIGYLPFATCFYRILQDPVALARIIAADELKGVIAERLAGVQLGMNDRLVYNKQAVDYLHANGLLFWGSAGLPGFAANPNLSWDSALFGDYHHLVADAKGYEHVSQTIDRVEIILAHPSFNWDFSTISRRSDLNWNMPFIVQYREKLLPAEVLLCAPIELITGNFPFFMSWCMHAGKEGAIKVFIYRQFELEHVMVHCDLLVRHEVSVNWKKLLQVQDKSSWIDLVRIYSEHTLLPDHKTFWSECTASVEMEFILNHADLPWDWYYITTRRLEKKTLTDPIFQEQYAGYLYWPHLVLKIYPPKELESEVLLSRLSILIAAAEPEIRKKTWLAITKSLDQGKVMEYVQRTADNPLFQWDWSHISGSRKMIFEHDFLNKFADRINWSRMCGNYALKEYLEFDKEKYATREEWEQTILGYFETYKEWWDFKPFSKFSYILFNPAIINAHLDKWDWTMISKEGNLLLKQNYPEPPVPYNGNALNQFADYINWEVLSGRHDVLLYSILVDTHAERNWDYRLLSAHPLLVMDPAFLIKYQDKDWNYQLLSDNKYLRVDKELILKLPDKNWDWGLFSNADWLDNELVMQLDDKPWEASGLTRNANLQMSIGMIRVLIKRGLQVWRCVLESNTLEISGEVLQLLIDNDILNAGNWRILSGNPSLDFRQYPELLEAYRDHWDWEILVDGGKINIGDINVLRNYCTCLNWKKIVHDERFFISYQLLNEFETWFDWKELSGRLPLDVDYLRRFMNRLDWSFISGSHVMPFTVMLVDEFKDYWDYNVLRENISISLPVRAYIDSLISSRPALELCFKLSDKYLYFLTNMTVATKILKHQQLQPAHFNFRFIGEQVPVMPVLFRFNLQQVILRHAGEIALRIDHTGETGNITELIGKFDFAHVDQSRDALLIKEVFDFSNISDYEVIVAREEDLKPLQQVCENKYVIRVDDPQQSVFKNWADRIFCSYKDDILILEKEKVKNEIGRGKWIVECAEEQVYEYLDGNVINATTRVIEGYPALKIRIRQQVPFKVKYFEMTSGDSWTIFESEGMVN